MFTYYQLIIIYYINIVERGERVSIFAVKQSGGSFISNFHIRAKNSSQVLNNSSQVATFNFIM